MLHEVSADIADIHYPDCFGDRSDLSDSHCRHQRELSVGDRMSAVQQGLCQRDASYGDSGVIIRGGEQSLPLNIKVMKTTKKKGSKSADSENPLRKAADRPASAVVITNRYKPIYRGGQ